jgi:hypothetical protein
MAARILVVNDTQEIRILKIQTLIVLFVTGVDLISSHSTQI